MRFLLFLLGIIFFFIFFLFSRLENIEGVLVGNLYFIAHIYIAISLLFVIGLFSRSKLRQENESPKNIKRLMPSGEDIRLFVKDFFSDYVYYIACLLFYMAVYFIAKAVYGDINASAIFLCLNFIVIILYFIEHRFTLFQDFIRVNLVIISLYYIINHIMYVV